MSTSVESWSWQCLCVCVCFWSGFLFVGRVCDGCSWWPLQSVRRVSLCLLQFATIVRSPLTLRAVPRATTLSETRAQESKGGTTFTRIGPVATRLSPISGTCHSIKWMNKCVFGDIFHSLTTRTSANASRDKRLCSRCGTVAQALATSSSLHLTETYPPLRGCGKSPQTSAQRRRRSGRLDQHSAESASSRVKDAMCRVAAPFALRFG